MRYIVTAFCLFFLSNAFAQDLIVTNSNDSLNAKISKVKDGYIYFTFKYKGEVRNTLMSKDSVKIYQYNYYPVGDLTSAELKRGAYHQDYPHWRFAANGGWSWLTAKTASDASAFERDYLKELKSGNHYGLEATYFIAENAGIGLIFNNFISSYSIDAYAQNQLTGQIIHGTLADDIAITYVGASFDYRFLSAAKENAFFMRISIGYTGYLDEGSFGSDIANVDGATVGLCYDLGYDFKLADHWYLGGQFSYRLGSLSTIYVTQNDGVRHQVVLEQGDYMSVSRVDLSLGLRYGF